MHPVSDPAPARVRVLKTYVSAITDPVRFAAGDVVGVGHRDRQWTSYVWCTDQRGHAGWVPDSFLQMTGAREGTALRDYDATELTVGEGELLDVIEEVGGWLLCRTARGIVGWVPSDHVEPAGPATE